MHANIQQPLEVYIYIKLSIEMTVFLLKSPFLGGQADSKEYIFIDLNQLDFRQGIYRILNISKLLNNKF